MPEYCNLQTSPTTTMSSNKKLILVIGATGAQGIAVIDALLAPSKDGSPSPYAVRAFTRNVDHPTAKGLAARGVELAQGERYRRGLDRSI